MGAGRRWPIDGLGEETAQRLVDSGLVNSLADIYRLEPARVAALEGMGEKSADQLLAAMAANQRPPLDRFLFGLGIDHIGTVTARRLADHYQTLDQFVQAKPDDLVAIEGIGPKVAAAITDWLTQPANRQTLRDLQDLGVKPQTHQAPVAGNGRLWEQKLVVSGRLERWGRTAVREAIRAAGGQIQSNLGPRTDYLVVGDNPGPAKLTRAETLGVVVLTEAQLIELLDAKQ